MFKYLFLQFVPLGNRITCFINISICLSLLCATSKFKSVIYTLKLAQGSG